MDKINRVLGITNTACTLLAGGSAIPLVKEKVKMNHMYGVRFAKSIESDGRQRHSLPGYNGSGRSYSRP
jgi:hypothetical protein